MKIQVNFNNMKLMIKNTVLNKVMEFIKLRVNLSMKLMNKNLYGKNNVPGLEKIDNLRYNWSISLNWSKIMNELHMMYLI